MSDQTGIEWTDKTWNPWYGCTKVSPGCAHCYMFRDRERRGQAADVVTRSKTTFDAPLKWHEPAHVFTCSWSDFFHEVADAWRGEAWEIIHQTPYLTYQILTKRPERIAAHLPSDWGDGWPHVWLGVSVENQRWRERADVLAEVPAALRFVSCEPLLGPVSFRWMKGGVYTTNANGSRSLSHLDAFRQKFGWVIVGGESGVDQRPMDEAWARTIRDECAEVGVPFFLKQLGGHPDARAHEKAVIDGHRHIEMPEGKD